MREIPIVVVDVDDAADEENKLRILCTHEDFAVPGLTDFLFDWMSDPDDDELEQATMLLRSFTTLTQVIDWLATLRAWGVDAAMTLDIATSMLYVIADDELI
jgi:hypothetical protein